MIKTKIKVVSAAISLMIICVLLVFVIYAFINPTLAWFSSDDDVTAEGLILKSDVSPTLSISETLEEILNGGDVLVSEQEILVLEPCTSIDGTLKYYDYTDIDPKTGKAKTGATLLNAVVNRHYFEQSFYIGSQGQDFVCSSLTAQIVNASVTKDYMKTVSVDFIINGVYKGTINYNDLSKTVDLGITEISITNPLSITVRCYFDGAMMSGDNAIFRSGTISTDNIVINVLYKAND